MTIFMKKFGSVLTSRQAGREAYAAYLPTINSIGKEEEVEIDFEGVSTFSPSWGDEFLTPLLKKIGKRIVLKNAQNPSVVLTISLLEKFNSQLFESE